VSGVTLNLKEAISKLEVLTNRNQI